MDAINAFLTKYPLIPFYAACSYTVVRLMWGMYRKPITKFLCTHLLQKEEVHHQRPVSEDLFLYVMQNDDGSLTIGSDDKLANIKYQSYVPEVWNLDTLKRETFISTNPKDLSGFDDSLDDCSLDYKNDLLKFIDCVLTTEKNNRSKLGAGNFIVKSSRSEMVEEIKEHNALLLSIKRQRQVEIASYKQPTAYLFFTNDFGEWGVHITDSAVEVSKYTYDNAVWDITSLLENNSLESNIEEFHSILRYMERVTTGQSALVEQLESLVTRGSITTDLNTRMEMLGAIRIFKETQLQPNEELSADGIEEGMKSLESCVNDLLSQSRLRFKNKEDRNDT